METGNIKFKRGEYIQTSTNTSNTILDFKLKNNLLVDNCKLFSEVVRLEYDNGFHDRSREFDYWLYFRNDTNWKRCSRTGLAKTPCNNLYEGNISREIELQIKTSKGANFETPHHLVIVQSIDMFKTLTIDIFNDFYISKKEILKHFVLEHLKKHPITKKEPANDSLICSNDSKNKKLIP